MVSINQRWDSTDAEHMLNPGSPVGDNIWAGFIHSGGQASHCHYLRHMCSSSGFNISASNMENLKIQPFEQTLIPEGGGLEVGLSCLSFDCLPQRRSPLKRPA
jgi:hypothetical protein